ncbi:C4-type zinc ribbon domain-containing protein [Desulfobacterota bacterium AH_259_B03_O07]|nr:C4-type zinc ribbon domain-containing protein [Desulfobacterota bacterium AH_259_B03_O07]
MRDQIAALGTLQQVDLELDVIEEKLENYPKEIYRYQEELENSKKSIAKAKEELEQMKINKNEMEQQLEQNTDTMKNGEKRLFEIKTYREYEALQKEISEAKLANGSFEEEILQAMEVIEDLENHINEKEQELSEKEKESEQLINDYEAKISELKQTQEIKTREKQKVLSLIKPEILPIYEKIKARNGIAIAPARNEICTGCNMNIPPQLFNEVLTLTRVIQCPNCGRILYCEESMSGKLQTA